jgi:hypothetical protein
VLGIAVAVWVGALLSTSALFLLVVTWQAAARVLRRARPARPTPQPAPSRAGSMSVTRLHVPAQAGPREVLEQRSAV